jgi:hypothetical protein
VKKEPVSVRNEEKVDVILQAEEKEEAVRRLRLELGMTLKQLRNGVLSPWRLFILFLRNWTLSSLWIA